MDLVGADIPGNLDRLPSTIAAYRRVAPNVQAISFSLDSPQAYKHAPVRPSQREFATIAPAGTDGKAYAAELRSQPYGARRAPPNWDRVTEFPKWAISTFIGVIAAIYVDVVLGTEPLHTCHSAFWATNSARDIFGLVLDVGKERPPARPLALLGAQVDIRPGIVESSLPKYSANALIDDLKQALTRGRLTPPQAAKSAAVSDFAVATGLGSRARPTRRSQRSPIRSHVRGAIPLNDDIRETLAWRIGRLRNPLPRRVRFAQQPPVPIYADACGGIHAGVVIFSNGGGGRGIRTSPNDSRRPKHRLAGMRKRESYMGWRYPWGFFLGTKSWRDVTTKAKGAPR